jgi:DNA sulfur modification protein DndC
MTHMGFAIPANEGTIIQIQEEYNKSSTPWFIGFSGGKDSSAILKLTFLALMGIKNPIKRVTVLYCDTGVDIPIFNELVYKTLLNIQQEAEKHGLPIDVKIVTPPIKEKYFSLVIGKGYPSPTNIFRWCTDRLRIRPVKRFLNSVSMQENYVLLGIRKGESLERDKTISGYGTKSPYFLRQNGNASTVIYAPIINYSTEDVWATVAYNPIPESIDSIKLMSLYRQASGECPIIKDPRGSPCGKGRFGCWTCTVVRKDKSIAGLVNEGHENLKPLLEFRNWLSVIRDDITCRSPKRRNGSKGSGPFYLETRSEILSRLEEAQHLSGYELIDKSQLEYIYSCWEEDKSYY